MVNYGYACKIFGTTPTDLIAGSALISHLEATNEARPQNPTSTVQK